MRKIGLDPFKKLNQGILNFFLANLECLRVFIFEAMQALQGETEFAAICQPEGCEIKLLLFADIMAKQLHQAYAHQGEKGDIDRQSGIPGNLFDHLPKGLGHSQPIAMKKYFPIFFDIVGHGVNCNAGTSKR